MYLLECTDDYPPMTYILNPKGEGGMYKVGQVIREYITNYADRCDKGMPLAIANIIEHALARGVEEMTITGVVQMKRYASSETYDKELTFRLYKEDRNEQ